MKTSLTTLPYVTGSYIKKTKNGNLNKNLANMAFLFRSIIPSRCNSCVFSM